MDLNVSSCSPGIPLVPSGNRGSIYLNLGSEVQSTMITYTMSIRKRNYSGSCSLTALHEQLGYCPHPVAVYIRGPIKGYI